MMYDIIIRKVELHDGTGLWSGMADIGLMEEPPRQNRRPGEISTFVVQEIGDLSLHGALTEIEANGRRLRAGVLPLGKTLPLASITDALQIHFDYP
jgi:N-acyl-D-aspartate/D-glutamate deacylase